ncbi:diacylglycerol/lipid kinase family protein [Agromyces cerinus]|uniref:Diacylglycerol kinase family enzyme n=1 Tax=Agromyces cerinus subsp. cerinus TaxID=232089 RepID=A0A1N6GJ37_9MICO|nr:diacylglycerol kinase family protein [Agromyces cerinus]SIO07543.1 Diacylglycerol kinase family enzyme [Agromyces cerinus subsp. cerinus]
MTADQQGAADVAGGRPRAAVIFNPTKQGVETLRAAVAAAEARQHFAPSLWIETAADDPGKGMARQALDAGVDLVIAAGGDGTVRSVAATLRGTGVPLGLVPIGTGNLFARNLEIPVNDQADAVVLAFAGLDRAVDLIVADISRADGTEESHVSLVMSGIGIDAAMISNTNPDLKKRVGWLAYVDAGLRALPASKPYRVVRRVDTGRHHRSKVSSILVANLGYLPGNIELIPDAEIDDGRLDVVVLAPRNLFGWLLIWRKITWENRVLRKSAIGRQFLDLTGGNRRSEIFYLRGRSVELEIEGDPEEFEIDGDEFGLVAAARFTVDPAALIVRVPR